MRSRARVPAALLILIAGLAFLARPRMLGDSGDYVMMALNLARFERPSLSAEDQQRAAARYPGDVSARLFIPEFVGSDGRQDLAHFWFYPLVAAPFVRAVTAVGADPIRGFTIINLLLLALAAAVLVARSSIAVTALVIAGPILWWIDKAQTEVFTFSLLTVAVVLLDTSPWWSVVALGAASTQNPPLAAAMVLAIASGVWVFGWRNRRLWLGSAAGVALAVLHPLYYEWRLGIWSTLRVGVDAHWPDLHEIVTPAIDPNLGIFFHDFPLTLALLAAALLLLSDPRRSPKRILTGGNAIALSIAVLLLVSFSQTTNVNSGGTPGPSRYGLWLIPLTLPLLATLEDSRWLRALTALSVIWCVAWYAPAREEHYVAPSVLAGYVWNEWPGLDNPVAEVFAERAAGREPAPSPPIVAPGGCVKALIEGTGADAVGLPQCYVPTAVTSIPPECRPPGVYCYANRTGPQTWNFAPAATTPYWRTIMARQRQLADRPVVSLEDGWSYAEGLAATRTQPPVSWRWMAERAEVRAVSPAAMQAVVKLQARANGKPRRLRIAAAGSTLAELIVSETPQWYETPPFPLAAGTTTFQFESLDGADAAPGDDRRLGIALFEFAIVSADPRGGKQ
jgi:hypothetical protein